MRPPDERNILQLAVQRGLLPAAVADELQRRSDELGRSVLELCVEESRLSRSTIDGLVREASGDPGATETAVSPGPVFGSSAETLGDPDGHPAGHGFPVTGWDRYQFVAYIGGGGMGEVYKAFDPRLQRHVALKFILRDDPGMVQRFKNEALAQAHIEHERVCRVHEVGEVEGRPYIAMQYIDGRPLNSVAGELALEQKLVILREVARGLHAAHRTGLIHRDVKPANILVERGETGDWRPYLVDFGLAKQAEAAGMTMTGVIVGTPYYMAPEQASGEGKRVDRRADVYGLGATLYEVLIGRPPFEGGSPTTILTKVLQEVPDSLHRSDTSIPVDVDAIVMKCLRKEPRERYPSARAFLEDVDRFLDGEPIQARPTGWLYRLKLKMVKYRTAVAVGAVALVLLIGALTWGGYTRWTAARRAGLAQAFGQQVERIAAMARQAYTIPLHDIRPELNRIREGLSQIERQSEAVGSIAVGPGHYALGRGAMALGDWETAQSQLTAAWDGGYRAPEVALALGRVLGERYTRELRELEQMSDRGQRETRRAEIQAALRDPALEYLRHSRGVEAESPELIEALIATYEERFDDALEDIGQVKAAWPALYRAQQLEGEIRTMIASALSDRGEYEAAFAEYARGVEAYRAAARVGESDPAVFAGLCALGRAMMLMEINGRGADVTPHFELGNEACETSLVANPDGTEALVLRAGLLGRIGEYRRVKGEDPLPALEQAVAAAQRAIELDESDALAHSYLGAALRETAKSAVDRGDDPRESLRRAVAAYRRSLELKPAFNAHNDLGIVYKTLADDLSSRGEDAEATYEDAIEAYTSSLAIHPDQVAANTNLGVVYFKLAPAREDPEEYLDRAITAFERATRINPNQMVVFYQMGRALNRKAQLATERGKDPRPALEAAIRAYDSAIAINPDSPYQAHFSNGLGLQYKEFALYERDHGGDPSPAFEQAESAFREAVAANPKFHFAHDNLGVTWMTRAAYLHDVGRDPGDLLDRAERSIRTSVELKPNYAFGWLDLAETHRQHARLRLARNLEARPVIEKGLQACAEAAEINPRLAEAEVLRARLLTLELATGRDDPEPRYREALAALDRAAEIEPDSVPGFVARAELELRVAELQRLRATVTGQFVEAGLDAVKRVLEKAPDFASVYLLRGKLLALRAEESRPDEQRPLRDSASESLNNALSLNSNLAHEVSVARGKYRL